MEQPVTSLEPTNGRVHYWDNVKGLLIILVLIGHFIAPYSCLHSVWNWIYLFHMPAFIVVCGYFSRRSSLQAPKMLKILLVFLVLNYTLMAITQGRAVSHWEWARVYYTAWFLLAVLIYRLTIPLLDRWNKPAALLFFSVAGLAAGLMREPDAFCLYKILPLYPFFIVGYTLAQRHERRWVPSSAVWKVGAGLLLLATLFVAGNWAIRHQILTGRHLLREPYDFYFRDAVARWILYFVGLAGTLGICWICPRQHLPVITRSGRHSLILYTIHRPVTILTAALIPTLHWGNGSVWMLAGALALTLLLCLLPATTHLFHAFFDTLVRALTTSRGSLVAMVSLLLLAAAGLGSAGLLFHLRPKAGQQALHVLQAEQKQQLDSCLKISFIGDIILLRPQVHRGYDPATGSYSFADLFRYTHTFFQDDDLSIAVFEGPCAGEAVGYTTTTCEDGNPIRLNFPDILARNVKEAGIDLVSTANNHLLDCGYEAALRTLRVLDEADLPHLGSYAPEDRGPRHRIVKMKQGMDNN